MTPGFTAVQIVPTGVGAAIGGFAGDAGPATKLLAAVVDCLVTHPNAVNGAGLLGLPANAYYVEGGTLDRWLAGEVALRPDRPGPIGLVLDGAVATMPEGSLAAVLNAAEAVRAVHGLAIAGYAQTARPLGCRVAIGAHGESTGTIGDVPALLDACRTLLAAGADRLAVMAHMGGVDPAGEARYMAGQGVDPIGGLEATISRRVTAELGVPCAHAPLEPFDPTPPGRVDPRAAAESTGGTYLPCILLGLARHPRIVPIAGSRPADLAPADAVVAPLGCLRGPGVQAAIARGIPVIAVLENTTVLDAALAPGAGVIPVANYLEAAGVLAALRAGLDYRTCRRPLAPLAHLAPLSGSSGQCLGKPARLSSMNHGS